MDKAKSNSQKMAPKEAEQPETATGKGTRSTIPCNVPEARGPRQFVPLTRKSANPQDVVPESLEKRPIIIHVTSLSTDPGSQRPSRLKRRPVKLRSGEFDEGAPLAKTSRCLRPLHNQQQLPVSTSEAESEPEAEVQQTLELEVDVEDQVEYVSDDYDSNGSDVDTPEVVQYSEATATPSYPVKLVRAGESLLISKQNPPECPLGTTASTGVGGSLAKAVASSDAATSISLLEEELARERAKNEALMVQHKKAKVVIENQCRLIVNLEETINSLRYRVVHMSAKCSMAPAVVEKASK